jgi:transposase
MYKVSDWVKNTTYLKVAFPDIKPTHLSDDRIADTLKVLFDAGIKNLFSGQTINIIKEFKLSIEQVHCDFTSATLHGDYRDANGEKAIAITYGFNKEHRPDKKQFVQEVAVTSDGGVPISSQSLDGNTSDVTRYVPVWRDIKQLMGSSDFLTVGDCKLSSEDNLLAIAKGKGYYLAPLAMYSSVKKELKELVLSGNAEPELLQQRVKDGKTITYHGFEVPDMIVDPKTGDTYSYRKIFVMSSQLKETQLRGLEDKLKKTAVEVDEIQSKLNHTKRLDSVEKINAAIESILKHYGVQGLVIYNTNEEVTLIKKKIGKGRASSNSTYRDVEIKNHSLNYSLSDKAIQDEKALCGYFILATNKSCKDLSAAKALSSYKQEWQVERIFERLKGSLQVIPMYLQLPEHIESMMYLLMTCTQVFTLMDREAKNTLAKNEEKLSGLFPNKIKTGSPKAELMMEAFGNISLVYMVHAEDISVSISGLNPLQAKILDITKINPIGYSSNYVMPRLDCDYVKEVVMEKANDIVVFK